MRYNRVGDHGAWRLRDWEFPLNLLQIIEEVPEQFVPTDFVADIFLGSARKERERANDLLDIVR